MQKKINKIKYFTMKSVSYRSQKIYNGQLDLLQLISRDDNLTAYDYHYALSTLSNVVFVNQIRFVSIN